MVLRRSCRTFAPVSEVITSGVGRYHVFSRIAAAVLLGDQVLSRTSVCGTVARLEAEFFWGRLPHEKVAVVAEATLGLECVGAKVLEALTGHDGLRNRKGFPCPQWVDLGYPEPLAMRAQHRRSCDRHSLCTPTSQGGASHPCGELGRTPKGADGPFATASSGATMPRGVLLVRYDRGTPMIRCRSSSQFDCDFL